MPPPLSTPGIRKVALIGGAETVASAPWYDPSWEIWTHAITQGRCKRITRVFEMHPDHVWRDHVKPQWPDYVQWLQRCPYPVYMLEKHRDIPSSVRYPRERIFGMCRSMIGRLHFGSHTDFMIALALTEGVTHLGCYGVQYTAPIYDGNRQEQLLSFKFWLGVAAGRGVHLELPEGHPSFDIPSEVYGLESHSTPEKYKQRLEAEMAVAKTTKDGVKADKLRPAIGAPRKPPKWLDADPDAARKAWNEMAPA